MPGDKSKISGMVLVTPWIVTIFENMVQFHLVNSDSWGGGRVSVLADCPTQPTAIDHSL